MKEERDILDLFSKSFDEGVPVGDADWQEISLKTQSNQFWKWDFLKMNAYYVGAIIVSFLGTFALGTDYYITKHNITEGYENKISELQNEVSKLKEEVNSIAIAKNDLNEKPRTNELFVENGNKNSSYNVQDVSTEAPAFNNKENSNQTNPFFHVTNEIVHPMTNVVSANHIEKESSGEDNEIVVANGIKTDLTIVSLVDGDTLETESLQNDSTYTDSKDLSSVKQNPYIKYVQDTIIKVDSVKIPRWRFHKSK